MKRIAKTLAHKKKQTKRFSKSTFELFFLMIGAALVALVALLFAKFSDFALSLNHQMTSHLPWLSWVLLPFGLTLIVWLTRRYAPYTGGSGIPQVIASIQLPHNRHKTRLVALKETLLKIPLTFLGMFCGASIGREGPSVQVGAAVMVSWGKWCRKHNFAFRGMEENNLLAIGAAGGLAAAFNAPLAGVIFAIEEMGRKKALRGDRYILIGVVFAGLFLISMEGNNPYFPRLPHQGDVPNSLLWILICGLICGISGGVFARVLSKGLIYYLPTSLRQFAHNHPLTIAFFCGLVLAGLGSYYQGNTYGTGYALVAHSLEGDASTNFGSLATGKWLATVFSYWSQVPGGIFTPCLSIGAIIGQSVVAITHTNIPPDFLVLMCMCAFLAAATQAPLTASVIVMEMTSTQNLIFWLMLCAILASLISRQFSPKPFYHFMAARFIERVNTLKKQDYEEMVREFEESPSQQEGRSTNPLR